jgi:hypothetical protein
VPEQQSNARLRRLALSPSSVETASRVSGRRRSLSMLNVVRPMQFEVAAEPYPGTLACFDMSGDGSTMSVHRHTRKQPMIAAVDRGCAKEPRMR